MVGNERASRTVAAALVACLFVVDSGGLAPSGSARSAAFSAVLGAGVVVVARWWPLGNRGPRRFGWLWLALLITVGLSAIASADRWHAVFGTSERNLGLLSWIGFAVSFAVGASLRPGSDRMVADAATFAVAAMSGLAFLEVVGLDPTDTAWPGRRVGAPFAQSTYLAVALVTLGPLVAGVALDRSGSARRRAVAAIVSLAGLAALLATQSRGPLLALGLALVIVLVVRGRPRVGIVVGAAAIAGVVGQSLTRGWGSVGGRLDEWRIGWRGIRASPLLGYGPEGYRGEFPRLVDVDYVRANGASVITDRAHNVFIDMALSSGVLAAVLLGGLWVLVARAAWGRVSDPDASAMFLGLAVGVVAGFTQQLVLFPLAEIDPVLWLIAGALVATEGLAAGGATTVDAEPWRGATWLLAVSAAAAMMASFWWNLTSAIGEHRIVRSTSFRQDRAEIVADEALAMRPQSIRLAYAASLVHANGPTLRDLDEAIAILERSLEQHPADPPLRTDYVFRLVERARRSALPIDADRATAAATAALELAPTSPPLIGAYAEALLLSGEPSLAREEIDRALELDPENPGLIELADLIGKS